MTKQETKCAVCDECGRERGDNEPDYNPVHLLMFESAGWYSGSDGEICGGCMVALFRRANRRG